MDTPITGSSSFGSTDKKFTVLRSQSSIAQMSVTWDSPEKRYHRESSCSPATLQKVNNWINSISEINGDYVDNIGVSDSPDFNGFDNGLDMEGDCFHSLKVASDLSKSDLNEEKRIELELQQYCNDTYSYEKSKKSRTIKKISDGATHHRTLKKYSHPKAIKRRKLTENSNSETKVDKSDKSTDCIPLSPESEKKKELCSYLQLMKPTDKKTVMILQNRRSVRVKNLSLMQEKRELEKKLKDQHLEETNYLKFPNMQYFNATSSNFEEKKDKWLKYSRAKERMSESFHFPHPQDCLKDIITDFDEAIQEDWFRVYKEQKEKQEGSSSNNNNGNNNLTKDSYNSEVKNGKSHVAISRSGNEISEKEMIPKTRQTIKRTCVMNKEKLIQEKKVISAEKMQSNKVKGMKQEIIKDIREKVPNTISPLNINQENYQFTESFNSNIKINANKPQKLTLGTIKSLPESFCVSNESLQLATGLHNIGNMIGDEKVLYNTDNSIRKFSEIAFPNPKTKISTSKKHKKQSPSQSITNLLKDNENLANSHNDRESPITIKNKLLSTKKNKVKKLVKKSRSMLLLRQNSSFKIKLVNKRKNSAVPNKSNKNLSERISNLKPDVLKKSSISSNKAENSGMKKSPATKKENLKEESLNLKKLKIPLETQLKSPLKDTNDNPFKYNVSELPKFSKINGLPVPPSQDMTRKSPKTHNMSSKITSPELNVNGRCKTELPSQNILGERGKSPPIMAIFKNQSDGLLDLAINEPEDKREFYSQILNVEKSSDENIDLPKEAPHSPQSLNINSTPASSRRNLGQIEAAIQPAPFISFKKTGIINPLHRCLNISKPKVAIDNLEVGNSPTNWTSSSPSHRQKKNQYSIHISKEHGPVLKIFYMEYNLVLCQESIVSLWTQTSLGNVLGAQNMWISKGSVQRLSMNNNCVFKESLEMVVSTDANVAYIELWTKEHQSDIREGPVADVFATVYFWKKGYNGMDKKVLQLQNINGFADDVQYSVLKSSPKIIVSWHLASNELNSKKTFIHCYELAADFQSVGNISEFEAVEHYVSSLHNIEGCDTLIMGCGENKITLWNIERGYVAATIVMLDIKSPLSTLWVKCDRGFLFTLQQCVDKELRLIAIHGMNHSWKKLASYVPPTEYDRLKGVCVENGIVLAFYEQGIVCWNAQTAETVLETLQNEAEYISGTYIISIVNEQIVLRHAITHLLSAEES